MIFPEPQSRGLSAGDDLAFVSDVRVELKYVISTETANAVLAWARQSMQPDEYCRGRDGYQVHTLYLDTEQGSVFHRNPSLGGIKYRVRRYGREDVVWLEAKHRQGDDVRKQRRVINVEQLTAMDSPSMVISARSEQGRTRPTSGVGGWFEQSVSRHGLKPIALVDYNRVAHVAATATGPCRLTVDSALTVKPHREWSLPRFEQDDSHEITSCEVLELKFRDVFPCLFRRLLSEFGIKSMPFSKYRTAASRCGLFAAAPESCGHAE